MIRRILVLVEEKALADRAVAYATELAKAEGADLLTLQVQGIYGKMIPEITSHHPDLVVLATHHRPSMNGLLVHGSADRIIGAHLTPVLLVDSETQTGGLEGIQILVPLDGSELAEAALPTALELAHVLRAGVTLLQTVAELMMPYAVPTELEHNLALDIELAWDPGLVSVAAQAALLTEPGPSSPDLWATPSSSQRWNWRTASGSRSRSSGLPSDIASAVASGPREGQGRNGRRSAVMSAGCTNSSSPTSMVH